LIVENTHLQKEKALRRTLATKAGMPNGSNGRETKKKQSAKDHGKMNYELLTN